MISVTNKLNKNTSLNVVSSYDADSKSGLGQTMLKTVSSNEIIAELKEMLGDDEQQDVLIDAILQIKSEYLPIIQDNCNNFTVDRIALCTARIKKNNKDKNKQFEKKIEDF